MEKMGVCCWVAMILLVIGGLNWGLVGIADFNLVAALFGTSIIAKIIYILVGLSAIYAIVGIAMKCKCCKPDETPQEAPSQE